VNHRTNYALPVFCALSAGILGLILALRIPSGVFPEFRFPRAIILADNSGLPREQMLVSVTRPLEEAAYGVPGTSLVRSTTSRGSAEIDVTFTQETDPVVGYQLLNAAIAEVRERLPQATSLNSRLLTTGSFPILDLSLSSKSRSLPDLTDIALYDLIPALRRISGVYRADAVGGKYRQYLVRLDPALLNQHRLTVQQVVDGLAAANVVDSPGRIQDEHRMLVMVSSSNLHSEDELRQLPIINIDSQPIRVSDVGTVSVDVKEDYIRTASEKGPAVLIGISRQPDSSIEQIAAQAQAVVADAVKRFPDVRFSFSYDQSALVAESFLAVRDAMLLGLALSFGVVLLFTGSFLSALIALIVVADCIAATVVVMWAAGLTFNMMTLGGLAAGIGLFIDDAIVMIEGIHRERARGAVDAVALAHERLTRPLVAATLTTIVVFVPLAALGGVSGTFFRSLAITLGAGLTISLLLALYVTPALEAASARWRRTHARQQDATGHASVVFARAIIPFTTRAWMAPLLVIAAVGVGVWIFGSVGTDYMPAMDEGAFILDYTTPAESTLADTQDLLSHIENILRETPEVQAFSRRTGTQLGFFLTESNSGDFSVHMRRARTRDIDDIIDSVRERVGSEVPGVRVEFTQVLQDFLGDLAGTPEPIEIKIFGADQTQIENTAHAMATALSNTPGLVDVFDGIVLSNPEEQLLVNNQEAQRYKIAPDEIQKTLTTVIEGTVATAIRSADRLIDVRVRYPDSYHSDLSQLSKVWLQSPSNGFIPLSAVVHQQWGGESAQLQRERLSPVVRVTARLDNIDLGSAIKLVSDRLAKIPLPAGVRVEIGGLYQQQQQAFRGMAVVMIVGLLAVFAVLLWEFGRVGSATAVLVGAIACVTGGLIGLYVSGLTLNVSSLMGLIMVVGIAAKNGILLLDYAEHARAEGESFTDAITNSIRVRMRPILMTAFATIAGMLPLALGLGAGARLQQPLAVVVIGGLLISLLLSVPIASGVYSLFTRRD
jgi:multidrug efflux pump subunit AcrB